MKSKTARDEQFPVNFLVPRHLRPQLKAYYVAARLADNIADDPQLAQNEKQDRLSKIKQAFCKPLSGNDFPEIRRLGKIFMTENLDASLFVDLLTAFERDAAGQTIRVWEELIGYCRYSAAPVGRFVLALYHESISAFLPAEQLCIILQLINHLGDIKADLSGLGRCYLPEDMMQKYGVRSSDLGLSLTTPAVKALLSEIIARIEGMLRDAACLSGQVQNFRLRLNVGVILSLTNSMLKKYKKSDLLQRPPRLSWADWFKAFVIGFCRAFRRRASGQGRVL